MNGQLKDDEITGNPGTHYSAEFWEYDTRTAHRWNIDPVVKDWESPYLCFNGNPILISDENGDDGGTAAAIFVATQEAAFAAAATGVGAPVAVAIEVVGTLWGLYELIKDAPVPAKPAITKTPAAKPKIQVHTADKTKGQAEAKTSSKEERRPAVKKKTLQKEWDEAKDHPDGDGSKSCPTCKNKVKVDPSKKQKGEKRDWDHSHEDKNTWSKQKQEIKKREAEGNPMSSKEKSENYQKDAKLECPSCNRSNNKQDK
jgi:hypothetical protein